MSSHGKAGLLLTDDGREIDYNKELAFLSRISSLLTDKDQSSYSGEDAVLSKGDIKALYEMVELYMFIDDERD